MKKILLLVLVALATSGCGATIRGTMLYVSNGVNLTVIHTCTNRAMVYHGQRLLGVVDGVTPQTVPVVPFMGSQYATVTVQSVNGSGQVVLTSTQSVYVDSYNQEQGWYIGDSGDGGIGTRYRSSCRR